MTHPQNTRPLPPLFLSSLSNRDTPLSDTTVLSHSEYQQNNHQYTQNPRVDSDDSDEDAAEAPPSLMIEMDPQPSLPTRRNGTRIGARGRGKPRFFRFAGDTRTPDERLLSPEENRSLVQLPSGQTLDTFFCRVYSYYVGKGYSCIVLSRIFNLFTLAFVVSFSTFLVGCIDFRRIKSSKSLDEILIPNCTSRLPFVVIFFLVIFAIFWVWQLIRLVQEIGELKEMRYYYGTILQISDEDIQTIGWKDVVNRVVEMRRMLPSPTSETPGENVSGNMRLSAHDVANRIMRKENFMIALFNKDIFDLSLPVVPLLRSRQVLTRTLEWNLSFCVLGFVFNKDGQVRKRFLRDVKRAELVSGLRRRFIFMGFVNVIFAPFIVVYLLMFFFFRYFEEFYKNPSSIGSRQYSPFARWKFREFNELPHYFQQRLNHSYQNAVKYIGQFPQENTAIIARFVAFIAGSFAAVLVVMTLADQDLLLGFELSKDRTVFFYISVFGAILAVARSLIPDENLVFEPERLLLAVVEDTHYLLDEWNGKMHTNEVKTDFAVFFEYKVVVFIQEILSVIFTPWVLWFSLPNCTEAVVDFFREFTVHVDGVGYVCSFAVFDFRRHGNARYGAPTNVNDERYLSKNGKMEKSFVNFKVNHPEWQPSDEVGSQYLSRLNDFNAQQRHRAPISTTSETSETSQNNHMMASLADVDHLHASIMLPRAPGTESPVLQAPANVPPSRFRPQPPPHLSTERQFRASHPALRTDKTTQRRSPALPGLYLSAAAAGASRLQESSPGSSMTDSSSSIDGQNRGPEGMLALLNQFYEQSQQSI